MCLYIDKEINSAELNDQRLSLSKLEQILLLSLLEVNFKVGIIPTDKWALVAATYLRESALKLYTSE